MHSSWPRGFPPAVAMIANDMFPTFSVFSWEPQKLKCCWNHIWILPCSFPIATDSLSLKVSQGLLLKLERSIHFYSFICFMLVCTFVTKDWYPWKVNLKICSTDIGALHVETRVGSLPSLDPENWDGTSEYQISPSKRKTSTNYKSFPGRCLHLESVGQFSCIIWRWRWMAVTVAALLRFLSPFLWWLSIRTCCWHGVQKGDW